jgi:hypothetical protein
LKPSKNSKLRLQFSTADSAASVNEGPGSQMIALEPQ